MELILGLPSGIGEVGSMVRISREIQLRFIRGER